MKRYPEYDHEQMKRDLESFMNYNDDDDDDDDNQIKIKYYNRNEYEEVENKVLWKDCKIVKKKSSYKLLPEQCSCDYFCKIMISYYANTDKKITPKNLYSPKERWKKLIVSGNYTEWKGYFLDSDLAKRFGVRALKYEKPDIKKLIENTYTCISILQKYMKDNEDWIDFYYDEMSTRMYDMYMTIEKIINAYHKKQTYTGLNKKEKNIISDLLTDEELEAESLLLYNLKSRDTTHKVFMNKSQLKDICEKLKKINLDNIVEKKVIKIRNENADERQVKFPEYLSPIIAAMCENRKNNPFYYKINIRGLLDKEIDYFNIPQIEKEEKEYLSKEFAKYYRYCKFANSRIFDEKTILNKYYFFLNLLMNKIRMYKPTYDNKYIHYYLVEKILGMQLFDTETEIILQYVESDLTTFKKKHFELGRLLKKIYEFRGCFSRITLAKYVLEEYFLTYEKKEKVAPEVYTRDIKKRIEHTDVVDKIRERLYIEDFLNEQEILIGQYEKANLKKDNSDAEKENSNLKMVKSQLGDYFNYEEKIKLDGIKFDKAISQKKINEIVSFQIQEKDDKWNEVKKWVILNSFF